MMDKLLTVFGALLVGVVILFVVAVIGGTIVWFLWPFAIPAVFPGLVAGGMITGKISWTAAVLFSWIVGILVKSSSLRKNSDD